MNMLSHWLDIVMLTGLEMLLIASRQVFRCTMMNNNLISWQSKKQPTVALSSTEARIHGVDRKLRPEIMWMRMISDWTQHFCCHTNNNVNVDLTFQQYSVSQNDTHHDRLNAHRSPRHYFIRGLVKDKIIDPTWISSSRTTRRHLHQTTHRAQPFITLRNKLMSDTGNHQH